MYFCHGVYKDLTSQRLSEKTNLEHNLSSYGADTFGLGLDYAFSTNPNVQYGTAQVAQTAEMKASSWSL